MSNLHYAEDKNAYCSPEYRQGYYQEFGLVMQIMRAIHNISTKDVADKMHVSEDIIIGYESGNAIPFVDALFLYDYLDMQNRPVFRSHH